jgi:membrane protease YdiL (CAAX protease family)
MSDGWHGQMGFKLAGFWTFILFNVALSLIMTWVYLNTKRSILSAMLLHFAVNFTAQLVAPYSDRVEILRVIPMLVTGLIGCTLINRRAHVQERV